MGSLGWPELLIIALIAVVLFVWPFLGFLIFRLSPRNDPDNRKVNSVLRLSKMLFLLVALVVLIGSLPT